MTAVVAVVGATASGKTDLGIAIAEQLGTEIISADSMQVYQGLEIGAAAPTVEEQARVRHHLISFLPVTAHYSAADFAADAAPIVERLNDAEKPAVVVGGAGLYLRALIDGLFEGPPRDSAFREALRAEAAQKGVRALYERLVSVDPVYASAIGPNDMRRIERGLEVYEATGQPMSVLHAAHRAQQRGLSAVQVAIDWPRERLYARIEARVDAMVAGGFVDEVRRLIEAGHGADIRRLRSRGHPEMAAHVRGEVSLEEAITLTKRNTRRMARRQLSWFRADERIVWLPAPEEGSVVSLAPAVLKLLTG